MSRAAIDAGAVAALRESHLDWRYKGLPSDVFGRTIAEVAASGLNLFDDGFVGPLMVIDRPALRHNLRTMADWCAANRVELAPHGKTTMAPQLFADQLAAGAWGMTAANASQLRVYRAFGVRRVLLANQLLDPPALRWAAEELRGDTDFRLCCWVDSRDGVRLMTEALAGAEPARPLDVLVELGATGARSGVRSVAEGLAVADEVAASPALRLAGVAGYEGALAHDRATGSVDTVRRYLRDLRELAERLIVAGRFDTDEVIVTAGGSMYFELVTEILTEPWPAGARVVPVLRSGSYLTHDDGIYRRISPFGQQSPPPGSSPFRPALRAWARVSSQPEPGLALLTMGKRDVPYDEGLPEPQVIRHAGEVSPLTGAEITALNDQHAFLRVPAATRLAVGDWVGCGVSHPCTVFDKWPLLPVVEGETVVDLIRTFF